MNLFVTHHVHTLSNLYTQLLSQELRRRITLKDWIYFSFYQTTLVRPNDISCWLWGWVEDYKHSNRETRRTRWHLRTLSNPSNHLCIPTLWPLNARWPSRVSMARRQRVIHFFSPREVHSATRRRRKSCRRSYCYTYITALESHIYEIKVPELENNP